MCLIMYVGRAHLFAVVYGIALDRLTHFPVGSLFLAHRCHLQFDERAYPTDVELLTLFGEREFDLPVARFDLDEPAALGRRKLRIENLFPGWRKRHALGQDRTTLGVIFALRLVVP